MILSEGRYDRRQECHNFVDHGSSLLCGTALISDGLIVVHQQCSAARCEVGQISRCRPSLGRGQSCANRRHRIEAQNCDQVWRGARESLYRALADRKGTQSWNLMRQRNMLFVIVFIESGRVRGSVVEPVLEPFVSTSYQIGKGWHGDTPVRQHPGSGGE